MRSRISDRRLVFERGDSNRYAAVLDYCKKFYASRVVLPATDEGDAIRQVNFGANADWVGTMLANPNIHDEDYTVLRYLKEPNSVLLDIGANWGYSAGAFHKLGIRSRVVSFEIIPLFSVALDELKRRFGDAYHFFITGLGEYRAELTFVVPVVNGVANSGLCSANQTPWLEGLARNILDSVDANPSLGSQLTLSFLEFVATVRPLDELVPNELPSSLRGLPIEAIKIDVEGLEYAVLAGGKSLVQRFRPLVLAEGANRTPGISELMSSLGYIFAERTGETLKRVDGLGMCNNGFFLHSDRLEEYQSLGVYQP